MVKHILVAHDLSPDADLALRRAAQLARQCNAQLSLAHVCEADEQAAGEQLQAQLDQLGLDDVRLWLRPGPTVEGLLALAGGIEADLLVLGRHHRQSPQGFAGTTLERILLATPIPLLLVTHPAIEPYRQALAALDYSRCANRALHAAWQLLPPEAKLHALNIEEVAEIHGADPAALALRQMALVQDELPKYLLAPEVSALLHYVPDLHRKMLLATLWNTGARINEALALTRSDFSLQPPYPFVQLATLKQRAEKAARTAGRTPAGSQPHRLVPLSDHSYVSQLEMMVATLKIPLERRNKRTGRTERARIWEITDRTVRTWLNEAVDTAAADSVTFSVPVTPHTFRHSYAMHMLYAGIPLKVLQSLMGHKSISSTEVYTKVFALDVAARHRVQFQMPGAEAVAMLKGNG